MADITDLEAHPSQTVLRPPPEDPVAQTVDHCSRQKLLENSLNCSKLRPGWKRLSMGNFVISSTHLSSAYSLALVKVSSSRKFLSSEGTLVLVLWGMNGLFKVSNTFHIFTRKLQYL